MRIEVKRGQSIYDIALTYTGDVANVYDICMANGLSLTDDVQGMEIDIPDAISINSKVVNSYSAKKIIPATSSEATVNLEGIGYWIIGSTFKVS